MPPTFAAGSKNTMTAPPPSFDAAKKQEDMSTPLGSGWRELSDPFTKKVWEVKNVASTAAPMANKNISMDDIKQTMKGNGTVTWEKQVRMVGGDPSQPKWKLIRILNIAMNVYIVYLLYSYFTKDKKKEQADPENVQISNANTPTSSSYSNQSMQESIKAYNAQDTQKNYQSWDEQKQESDPKHVDGFQSYQ